MILLRIIYITNTIFDSLKSTSPRLLCIFPCQVIMRPFLENISIVTKSEHKYMLSKRSQKRKVRKAGVPGEFEGVIWHGGYDQSITSSATRAPHTASILPGPLPFARYTFAAAKKAERKRDDENREESHDARLQIRLPAMTLPQPVEIERDSSFCMYCTYVYTGVICIYI